LRGLEEYREFEREAKTPKRVGEAKKRIKGVEMEVKRLK
jgi:hypothetical protein